MMCPADRPRTCVWCDRLAGYQCDFISPADRLVCVASVCDGHSQLVEVDGKLLDVCPPHARALVAAGALVQP